ncbi:MAG: hypothetical protein QOG31_896 [Thermoplasmata archaeon]|jgi:uncharacterized protein YbcC (UPF0753/DUF2309 family)|nr:hypothetical protein [Thermoplasmata archaeon]
MSRMTPRRRDQLDAAARDARALREAWRQAMQHHQVRVEAQFRELSTRLKAPAKGRVKKGLPSAKLAEKLHETLAKARLKPVKGRAKDLRRVEKLVQDALDSLPQE